MDLKVYIMLLLGGSFSLFMFIETLVLFWAAKKFNIGISKIAFMADPWFNLSSFKRKNTTYTLGWLPLMSTSASMAGVQGEDQPGEEVFEADQKFRNKSKGVQLLFGMMIPFTTILLLLICIPFISSAGFIENWHKLLLAFKVVFSFFFSDTDYHLMVTYLKISASNTNDFIFIMSFMLGWFLIMAVSGGLTAFIARSTDGNKTALPLIIVVTVGQLAATVFILFSLFKIAFLEFGFVTTMYLSGIYLATVLGAGTVLFFLVKAILPKTRPGAEIS